MKSSVGHRMTPEQILTAWERTILIFADENYNAHCVFGAAKASSEKAEGWGRCELVLTYPDPANKIEAYNADVAKRGLISTTMNVAFRRACEELGFDATRVPPIRIVIEGEKSPELPEPDPELPDHDDAPAPEALTDEQRAAATAYDAAVFLTHLVGRMIAHAAKEDPAELLELATELDGLAGIKRSKTATGYAPSVERRIALFVESLTK